MSTATITRPESVTIAPAAPLSVEETNQLIELAASAEKVARVKAGTRTFRETRGWAVSGSVD